MSEREDQQIIDAWDELATEHEDTLAELDDLHDKIRHQAQRVTDAPQFPSMDQQTELNALLSLLEDLPSDLYEGFHNAKP